MLRSLAAACLAALLSTPAAAAPFDWTDLVVFGDSLSDAGNFGFTITNGQPWAGQLGAGPGAPFGVPNGGTNFAFGGASAVTDGDPSPDLALQLGLFGAATSGPSPVLTLGSDPLVVTWLGGNDIRGLVDPDDGTLTLAEISAGIDLAVQTIVGGVASLIAADVGLDRFVLPGLPDFSLIPEYLGRDGAAVAGQATDRFNLLLQQGIAALDATSPAAVRYADIEALFDGIVADPTAFGFVDASTTCNRGATCTGLLWWDDIHPTEAAHALVAETIRQAAPPIPLPGGMALLLGGLGAVVTLRRRAVA